MNRRQWMKGAAAGLVAGVAGTARSEQIHAIGNESRDQTASALTGSWTKTMPGIWRSRLGTPESYTPVSSRLIAAAEAALATLPNIPAAPIEMPAGETDSRGCRLRLPLSPAEEIYGFGLQMLSFPQRGKKKTIRVNADPRVDSGDAHAPVPFFVSTRGYGLLVDSCRHVAFYCGDARLRPEKSLPLSTTDAPPDTTSELPMNAAGTITVEVPRAAGADVYLFAGPSMIDAVRRYNLFSGGGVEPPTWGLGFWYRADGKASQQAVADLAHQFRDRNIPCDVLGLEPGWQSHSYSCSFVWDKQRFPDPPAFLHEAAGMGFHVNLWEHAFTHPSSPLFEPLLDSSGNYGVFGGLVPDFARSPARKIFGDYHGKYLIESGISGFKLDECDNSDFTGGWSFPDFSVFPSGLDVEQMHAVFGLRYQAAILEQYRQRKQTTFGLVRSSGALAAPYPFVLYSDLYDHRVFVRALVNSGFSGLLWCPEVRDAVSDEDLIRRLQTVVFSPLAMVNAWYIQSPPWKQIDREKNNAGSFAPDWEALESRCRTIIGWRMQLVPYLRSAYRRYATDGTPPFRALVLDYPEEEALRTVDDEYMMGDRMLVAPLFAGESERTVVLPRGQWQDFWTGASVEGGRSFSVPSSTEEIPVYVKAGSILPLAGIGATTEAPESRELTVRVYGDGQLPWKLDGEGGLELQWQASNQKIAVKNIGAATIYHIVKSEHLGESGGSIRG